jgi:ribokinase
MYGSRVAPAVRLTVLGSLNMDISVTVPRLPVPGATVLGGAAAYAAGGKGANQAVAAARLGASVRMVGCVGDDDFGGRLRAALRAEGVEDAGVRAVPGVPTGLAMITVDGAGENMITVAPGANREVGRDEITTAHASPADVLVISAEIPVPVIKAALAVTGPALRVLNLAPAPPEAADLIAVGVDWLVVNQSEAASVIGRPVDGLAGAARAAAHLVKSGPRNAVVTAGAEGAAYRGTASPGEASGGEAPGGDNSKKRVLGEAITIPGFRVHAVDSVGAGDTFVGALAAALGAGVTPEEAIRAAAAAGAAAVTRPGTQSGMPRPADILAVTGLTWPDAVRTKQW